MKFNFSAVIGSYKFLNFYTYLPLVALVVGSYIVFFAEDKYRYECQDPQFWDAPECNPPICLATGTCTSDLISLDGNYSNRYQDQVDQFIASQPQQSTPVEPEVMYEEPPCDCSESTEYVEPPVEDMFEPVIEPEGDADPNMTDQINQLIEEIKTNE
jgi:hypothetical protein